MTGKEQCLSCEATVERDVERGQGSQLTTTYFVGDFSLPSEIKVGYPGAFSPRGVGNRVRKQGCSVGSASGERPKAERKFPVHGPVHGAVNVAVNVAVNG